MEGSLGTFLPLRRVFLWSPGRVGTRIKTKETKLTVVPEREGPGVKGVEMLPVSYLG